MKPIFDACVPRDEILKGELKEDIFAARLKDVVEGKAEDVYRDPATFFENTFPTEGLKILLYEALGRLTGVHPSNKRILRLETSFGGGKTHNLIALYHAANGHLSAETLKGIVPPEFVPSPGAIDVAAVVGTDLDPSNGLQHEDGLRTYTLWGELAYQLGRRAGYALARESDKNRTAPGTALFNELIGIRPTLIMIDEIAEHMRVAQSVPAATGKSDLAEQTVAFLMALLEFVASRSNVVLVFTLAGDDDAFRAETANLRQQLTEARRVTARQEMVITPTGETEVSAIVTHRLFPSLDRTVAEEVAHTYSEAYKRWYEQNVELPQGAVRAEYAADIAQDYPFHPELLNTLNRKTSTIPNFQKTRGALRLLALVVRQLWQQKSANTWLIHPHHVDLAHREIANDLTSRLQRPAFQQVIEADIVSAKKGSQAHGQEIDEAWIAAGKPPYARRVATTVFLHSLSQGIATGVDPADLRLAVLQPGDDPLLIERAVERLEAVAWFFEWDGRRFRFKTEPSLNKIILDEMGMIGHTKAKQELDSRIQNQQVWKSGTFRVVPFPQEAADVDDDARAPKLAIIHYDAATMATGSDEPPELVRKIFDYSGVQGAFRTYKNNVIFLVADGDLIDNMVEVAQRYLAISRIVGDVERMREFPEEQRKKLKKMGEAAELDVRVAITRAYRHLFFPRSDAPQAYSNLAHDLLPSQDQGQASKDQSEVVLRALKLQNKLLTSDEKMLSAAYVRSRAWDRNQESMTAEELRKAFARRMSLPILLDLNQLKKTVKNGVDTGTWVYYDAQAEVGYDHASPPPAIQITDEAILYTPEEAARRQLPIKGKLQPPPGGGDGIERVGGGLEQRCPVCLNPVSQCTCRTVQPQVPLRGEGPPQQAFQRLLDACHDQGVSALAALRIGMEGNQREGAQNLRTLGLVLPQLGRGNYRIELKYSAAFGPGNYVDLNLQLDDTLYKRLKQVTDALAQEASEFYSHFTLHAGFDEGLDLESDQFRTIHEVFTTVGLGRIEVAGEATPTERAAP